VTLCAVWMYAGAHQTDGKYNTAFSVINGLCEPVNNTWYIVYMYGLSFHVQNFLITCGLQIKMQ
jgi:hypothetical protein